jgi:hypothetical protein
MERTKYDPRPESAGTPSKITGAYFLCVTGSGTSKAAAGGKLITITRIHSLVTFTNKEDKAMTDLVGKIMAWEGGEMDQAQEVEFFQELIDNGMAWTLQGMYGRNAQALIEAGLCRIRRVKK